MINSWLLQINLHQSGREIETIENDLFDHNEKKVWGWLCEAWGVARPFNGNLPKKNDIIYLYFTTKWNRKRAGIYAVGKIDYIEIQSNRKHWVEALTIEFDKQKTSKLINKPYLYQFESRTLGVRGGFKSIKDEFAYKAVEMMVYIPEHNARQMDLIISTMTR